LDYLKAKYLIEKVGLKFNELYLFIDISDIEDEIVYEKFTFPSFIKRTDYFFKRKSLFYQFLRDNLLNKYKLTTIKKDKNFINNDNYANMFLINSELAYEDRDKWTYDSAIFEKWGAKGLKLAKENTIKLYDLCKKNNITMNIVVYPKPMQILNSDLESIQVIFWKTFSLEKNINFISFFPCFINDTSPRETIEKYFIKGDVHWNENGNKLIADILFVKIVEDHKFNGISY
jgi:hypothetical protein